MAKKQNTETDADDQIDLALEGDFIPADEVEGEEPVQRARRASDSAAASLRQTAAAIKKAGTRKPPKKAAESLDFTLARLKALKPKSKTYTCSDTKNPALSVRVSPGGVVTFQVRRRLKGSPRVVTVSICRLSDGTPIRDIRNQAGEIVQLMNTGVNPNVLRKEDATEAEVRALTLRGAYTQYLGKLTPYKEKPLSARTIYTYNNVIDNLVPDWADSPMIAITPLKLYERYRKVAQNEGPGSARMMAATIGAVWTYANVLTDDADEGDEAFGPPPLRKLTKLQPGWRKGGARTRKIGMGELPEWLSAVRDAGDIGGAYLEILLLTGMRRRELANLVWKDVDLRRRTMVLRATKNGSDHTLPLSDRVLEILQWSKRKYPHTARPVPLNDPRTIIKTVSGACGIAFSCHDLRRTFTTMADRSGAGMYAAKAILNHSVGKDVTGAHYASYDDVSDLREPLQQIEGFILAKAKAHRDNVLQVVK